MCGVTWTLRMRVAPILALALFVAETGCADRVRAPDAPPAREHITRTDTEPPGGRAARSACVERVRQGGVRARQAGEQAGSLGWRRGVVPLVPRDGGDELPRSARAQDLGRELRHHQGRRGRAARSGGALQRLGLAGGGPLRTRCAGAQERGATLPKQTKIIDPVWGGIYQYSAASDWEHPHFEKLATFHAAGRTTRRPSRSPVMRSTGTAPLHCART